jgi:hypothetical protein
VRAATRSPGPLERWRRRPTSHIRAPQAVPPPRGATLCGLGMPAEAARGETTRGTICDTGRGDAQVDCGGNERAVEVGVV